MNRKEVIEHMWADAFADSNEWRRWFFENVYDDNQAMLSIRNGTPLSSLLLQKRSFNFCGNDVPCGYIAGATTAKNLRSRGFMSELMNKALIESYARGDVFVSLIPATDSLYFFYDKFGFATVIYREVERYTALHRFDKSEAFKPIEPDFKVLESIEKQRDRAVRHSEKDWSQIVTDLTFEDGYVCACVDNEGNPVALAIALERKEEILVKYLGVPKGSESSAAEYVLSMVRDYFGSKPVEVWAMPGDRKNSPRLRARGMMRIVDANAVLSALALHDRKMQQVILLRDPIVHANNGYYIIRNGECRMVENTMRPVTLAVDISTLTSIIFSSSQIVPFLVSRVHVRLLTLCSTEKKKAGTNLRSSA